MNSIMMGAREKEAVREQFSGFVGPCSWTRDLERSWVFGEAKAKVLALVYEIRCYGGLGEGYFLLIAEVDLLRRRRNGSLEVCGYQLRGGLQKDGGPFKSGGFSDCRVKSDSDCQVFVIKLWADSISNLLLNEIILMAGVVTRIWLPQGPMLEVENECF